MTDAIIHGTWDAADAFASPGSAAGWTRASYQALPGFAAFRQYGGSVAPEERFDDASTSARASLVMPGATFLVGIVSSWAVASVVVAPTNAIVFAGIDLHYALRPGVGFLINGPAGHGELDGYWTVDHSELVGSDTVVYVTEDVLAMAAGARIYAAAAIDLYACDHAHSAEIVDTTSYPVAALAAGATIVVRIDRGDAQTLAFPGGETTARDVADALDDLVTGGGARVVGGQVAIFSDTLGPGAFVQVEAGTAALTFPTYEERGWGQPVQVWPDEVVTPAAATTAEVAAILRARAQHVAVRVREAAAPTIIDVETTRTGASATLDFGDLRGSIYDAATWPIPARTAGVDDTLLFWESGVGNFTVTLDAADITPELVAGRLAAAFVSAGSTATATASADRVYVDSPTSFRCRGGTANTDLAFPTHYVQGGGPMLGAITVIGPTDGEDDVGFQPTFDEMAICEVATFAAESGAATDAEAFVWTDVRGPFGEDDIAAPFASFHAGWTADADSFAEGWNTGWIETYAPATPTAGAWEPPGIAPDARIVGSALTFPVTVLGNRANLAIYSETDEEWHTLAVTPGVYATAAALAAEVQARLTAAALSDDLAVTATADGSLAIGWDGSAAGAGAIHLATPRGAQTTTDARPTLGLFPLPAAIGATAVDVPAEFYDGETVANWDADNAYGVDSFARLVFAAATDAPTGEVIAVSNGFTLARFNTLDALIADSWLECFAWVVITAGGAYVGWPLATFDASLTPETAEDFEEGW